MASRGWDWQSAVWQDGTPQAEACGSFDSWFGSAGLGRAVFCALRQGPDWLGMARHGLDYTPATGNRRGKIWESYGTVRKGQAWRG